MRRSRIRPTFELDRIAHLAIELALLRAAREEQARDEEPRHSRSAMQAATVSSAIGSCFIDSRPRKVTVPSFDLAPSPAGGGAGSTGGEAES